MPQSSELAAVAPDFSSGGGIAFGPSDLYTFYNETPLLNAGTNGNSGDCIAVAEDSDFNSNSVTLFDSNFSLAPANLTRVFPDGASPGINGDEVEVLLDIEWAHAVAPGAPINVYRDFAPGRDNQAGYRQPVRRDQHKLRVLRRIVVILYQHARLDLRAGCCSGAVDLHILGRLGRGGSGPEWRSMRGRNDPQRKRDVGGPERDLGWRKPIPPGVRRGG